MPETILLVDDDPHLLRIAEMLFELEGYNVVTAKSGEQAMDVLGTVKPHLILLDVMMPGLDGAEVCRQVRADERLRQVPIAVFTAAETRDEELREAGADEFILKPYSIDGLRDTVRAMIDRAAKQSKRAAEGRRSRTR